MRARKQWLWLAFLTCAWSAPAQQITEEQAVRQFLATSPMAQVWQSHVDIARAEWRGRTLLANPSVAASQEDAAGSRDQFLTFQQTLPVTGRLNLLRRAGTQAMTVARSEAERRRQIAVADFRKAFLDLAAAQQRAEVLRANSARLEELVRVLREREAAGEGSGFDVLRAERELADAGADAALARVAVEQARARLASFAPGIAAATIATVELPGGLPPIATAVAQAAEQRPDNRATRAQEELFQAQRSAASREAIPEPTISAGLKRTTVAGVADTGYVAGLTIPLPVFNRGQADVQRFTSEGRRAAAERLLLERQIEAEVRSTHAAATQGLQLAREYDTGAASEFLRSAEAAYQEGERGILELLDAYRLVSSTDLRRLELLRTAKEASIDLDLAMGVEVRP
jgi:cobalt-zinc-cadmium efflux system outer membrane protein